MTAIYLSPAAQVSLVIIAVINVLLLSVIVAAAMIGVQQFKKLREQVQPIIDRVNPILDEAKPLVASVNPLIDQNVKPILMNVQEITHKVSGIVTDIGNHAHEIAETGEHTVKEITHRVGSTSQMVTENVSKPVISAASLIAGVSRAFSVLKHYKPEPDNNTHRSSDNHDEHKSTPSMN